MRITKTFLRQHRACEDQVELFASVFPRGGKVTKRRLVKAARAGLDVEWLDTFIPDTDRPAYWEAIVAAGGAYKEAIVAAGDSYNGSKRDAAIAAYDEAIAAALAEALRDA